MSVVSTITLPHLFINNIQRHQRFQYCKQNSDKSKESVLLFYEFLQHSTCICLYVMIQLSWV